jgi:hypothetical protein
MAMDERGFKRKQSNVMWWLDIKLTKTFFSIWEDGRNGSLFPCFAYARPRAHARMYV